MGLPRICPLSFTIVLERTTPTSTWLKRGPPRPGLRRGGGPGNGDDHNSRRPKGFAHHPNPSEFAKARSGQLPNAAPSQLIPTGNGGRRRSIARRVIFGRRATLEAIPMFIDTRVPLFVVLLSAVSAGS